MKVKADGPHIYREQPKIPVTIGLPSNEYVTRGHLEFSRHPTPTLRLLRGLEINSLTGLLRPVRKMGITVMIHNLIHQTWTQP